MDLGGRRSLIESLSKRAPQPFAVPHTNTMIQTETQPEPIISNRSTESFESERELSLLDVVVVLLEKKRFIARFVVGATDLATLTDFLLPVRYEGKVVLMPPAQNSSIGSSLLGQLGGSGLGALASLAGGSLGVKNPADMYVSLLTSRTVEDAMIQRFGLMQEYHEKRISDARKEFESRTSATAGTKD